MNERRVRLAGGLLALIALLVGLAGPVVSVGAAPDARPPWAITDSLTAHWKFNEASGTRLDEMNGCGGSGCDLTDNNTVTQAGGKLGNAAQFTSANSESLTRADHADISTGDISFTWALWVYFDSVSGEQWMLAKRTGADLREYVIRINAAGSTKIEASTSSAGGTNYNLVATSFGNVSAATWYFVVLTYDSSADTLTLCVNNVCDSLSSVLGPADTTGVLAFGYDNLTHYFGGRLDSVTFWKRAITSAERSCLYNAGSGTDYPFSSCDATPTPTVTATSTETLTPTPAATNTATATSTETLTPTPGPSSTPTNTPTSTETATAGPSPTATSTATVTATPATTNTPTPTVTVTPLYDTDLELSTGTHLLVTRSITQGEVLIFLAVLLVAAIQIVRQVWDMAKDAR
ncbi:MAG: LamG domain-containing protein [Anaerolineales bacterium]|nr:LamG domain-containing protein [Anaerolineales bacterium]